MEIVFRILMDAFFIALLAWSAYTDIRTRVVSNVSVILLLCFGLAHMVLIGFSGSAWWPYPAGLTLGLPFLILWLKSGMGAGDVKLLMGIGLYLGLANTLISFFLMLPMLIACMIYSLRKRGTIKMLVPFAPVLTFGAVGTVMLGYLL